jgi:hypothetical protein
LRFKGITVLTALLALSACAYKHRPIYNVDDPMPRWMQSQRSDRMEDLIVGACNTLGWKTQHVGQGHILAIQSREKFSATVDILFDQQHWQIRYQSSDGLLADGDTIHSHYNAWVHNLEHEIQLRFNSAMPPAGQ